MTLVIFAMRDLIFTSQPFIVFEIECFFPRQFVGLRREKKKKKKKLGLYNHLDTEGNSN